MFWVMMVILTVIFLGPLVVMILTSFKTSIEAKQVPATFFPHTWTLRAYRQLLFVDDASPVLRWVLNSFVAATVNSVLTCLFAAMAAYAFARLRLAREERPVRNRPVDDVRAGIHLSHAELRVDVEASVVGLASRDHLPGNRRSFRSVLPQTILRGAAEGVRGERED